MRACILKNFKYCLLVIGQVFGFAVAQENFSGKVLDSSNKNPVINSSIISLSTDSLIVNSTRTDLNGEFIIKRDSLTKFLFITHPMMGDVTVKVDTITNNNLGKIIMSNRALLLEEVEILVRKAMVKSGDTLVYNADYYNPGDYARVEDLLKRLPGINILDNGSIQHMGKSVSKVLVDGDEFIKDDPTLVLKYIRADAISKVEVYEKQNNSKSSVSVSTDNEKIINLKLKKEYKKGLIGDVTVNKSIRNKADNYSGLLSFFRDKLKVSGILKYDIIDTTYNSINNKLNFGPLSINSFVESNFYQKYTGRPSGLTQNRIESSFQFINKWEKGQELQVNYNRNSLSTLDRIESKFYNVVTPEIYFSNENLTDENKEISNNIFNLQFKTNLDSTTKLRFDANINLESFELDLFRKFKSYNWHSSEENSISSSGTQDGESSLSIFNLNVEKEFKQSTLSFSLQPSFNKELIVQNSKSSVGALDSVININRTIDLKRKMLSSYINYEHFLTDNLQSNISYGISIEKSNQTEDISSISRQHITGQSQVVSVDFNYLIKKIGVTSGVRAFFNNINFKDDNLQEIRNFNRNWMPNFEIKYSVSENSFARGGYLGQSIHPTTWQLQSFVNNFDIQNSYVGNPQLKPAFNNRFFLNYEYMNLSKQEIFIFSTNWNKTNNYHSNSYVIDSLNNILNSTTNTFMNELNIALNYSRYFVKSKINIQNTLSFGYKNFEELINYIPNEISEKNILIKNSISIRPKDFLSIAYSSMILLSYHESSILKRFDGKNFIHNHSLINYIKLPQRFRFDLAYRVVSMPTDEEFVEDINIHNLDIKFSKSFLKANPMTFSFSIKNIFDNDKLFVKQLNSNYLSQRSSLHMRRLFAVGINWNLSKTL